MYFRIAALSVLIVFAGSADTLVLRNGRTVQGAYLGGTSRQVRIAVGDRIESYDVSEVESIRFEGMQGTSASTAPAQPSAPTAAVSTTVPAQPEPAVAPAQAAVAAPAAPPSPAEPERRGVLMRPSSTAPAPAPAGLQVPAGTQLVVRMIDDVDSQTAQVGQTYRASIDEPVVIDGRTAIPRGADVITKLVELKEPGKITGGGQLTLDLASVTINGRTTEVASQTVTQAGESGKQDSAKVIGGTAALGAIIGAIAGGGKGAAIGAVSGAGAGTAIRVMTQGARVRVPSETRLTFTLQQPLRIP